MHSGACGIPGTEDLNPGRKTQSGSDIGIESGMVTVCVSVQTQKKIRRKAGRRQKIGEGIFVKVVISLRKVPPLKDFAVTESISRFRSAGETAMSSVISRK